MFMYNQNAPSEDGRIYRKLAILLIYHYIHVKTLNIFVLINYQIHS